MKLRKNYAVWCLLCLLYSCGSNTAPEQEAPPELSTSPPAPGKMLFDSKCAACHGEDGTAGIGNAANLQTSKLDSVAIISTLTNGRNAMPAFKNVLTNEEIAQLAHYVQLLRK